jgi:hypothetical protein
VCLVGSSQTLVRAQVEANLPRKRGPAVAGYDKAWAKFLDNVFAAVVRHVDWCAAGLARLAPSLWPGLLCRLARGFMCVLRGRGERWGEPRAGGAGQAAGRQAGGQAAQLLVGWGR